MREGDKEAGHGFPTTHWTHVLAAGGSTSPQGRAALESLAHTYWYPLYAFARRGGQNPEDAADSTQGFFAALLHRQTLAGADPLRGRFRSYLLTAFKHFMADAWKASQRQKRSPGSEPIPIDVVTEETRYQFEPAHELDAERLFQRRCAIALLDRAFARLEKEFTEAKRGPVFEVLREYLAGDRSSGTYAEAARVLLTTEGAIKVTVSRMRRRMRELIRDEIARTVATPAEIDDEYRALIDALRA